MSPRSFPAIFILYSNTCPIVPFSGETIALIPVLPLSCENRGIVIPVIRIVIKKTLFISSDLCLCSPSGLRPQCPMAGRRNRRGSPPEARVPSPRNPRRRRAMDGPSRATAVSRRGLSAPAAALVPRPPHWLTPRTILSAPIHRRMRSPAAVTPA